MIAPEMPSEPGITSTSRIDIVPVQEAFSLFTRRSPTTDRPRIEPSPVLCALPLLEGWRDVDQVRREHQGQGGTTGPRAPRRLRIGVGGDEGDLGPAGDEPGDAAQVGAPDRDRRR